MAVAGMDAWMAAIPRKRPEQAALQQCKIVSHRGEHDNSSVRENTLHAFEIARSGGVWGIETDIRWTADLVPVIIHDPDTRRVFGKAIDINKASFSGLRTAIPEIPTLAELLEEFGGNTHLMLELKAEEFPHLGRQKKILRQHLSNLKPVNDYHVLALEPDLFEIFDIRPRNCCLPVAQQNIYELSEKTLVSGYGGLTGHYFLLRDRIRRKHYSAGQQVGTGFVRSRNCLYREVNRGIEWIFSNDAVKLKRMVNGRMGSPRVAKDNGADGQALCNRSAVSLAPVTRVT